MTQSTEFPGDKKKSLARYQAEQIHHETTAWFYIDKIGLTEYIRLTLADTNDAAWVVHDGID